MSYEDIRLIFERVWDQNHAFVPKDSEIEKEVMKRPGFDFPQKSIKKNDKIKASGSSKKRSREDSNEDNAKKQKLEDNAEKEELRDSMDVVPRYDIAIDVDEMLDDFDRQDVMDLHRLVQERYDTTSPEGYDLLLWGDLKILFEPNEEDEIWKNQQDYNLISWRLFDSCGIHMLLMHTGIAIHMMIEKKYPLTQEMLSRMLSRRLEVDQESEMAFELLRHLKKSRCEIIPYPRFAKVIINHFLSNHSSVPKELLSGLHTIKDDVVLSRLKFVRIGEDVQEYGRAISDAMLTNDIKQSETYQMFIKYSTGVIPPKKNRCKRSQGKKAAISSKPASVEVFDESDSEPLGKSMSLTEATDEEAARKVHATHEKIVTESDPEPARRRPSGIAFRDTSNVSKKMSPDRSQKLKGVQTLTPKEKLAADIMQALNASRKSSKSQPHAGGSSKGTSTKPGVPNESTVILTTSSKGTGAKPGVPDEEKIDWVYSDEDEEKKDDDDKSFDIEETGDEETDDKFMRGDDQVQENVDEEMKDKEVDDTGNSDEEITNMAKADAEKTKEVKDDNKKAELPPLISGLFVSSGFGNQFLNLYSDKSTVGTLKDSADAKINSLLNLVVLSTIPEIPTVTSTTTPLPPNYVSTISPVLLQQTTTLILTPPITTKTPPITKIPDPLPAISQSIYVLEKDVQDLKTVDHTIALIASLRSRKPSAVNAYLGSSPGYALQKTPTTLAQSSSQAQSSLKVAESLSKYKLKTILFEKIDKSCSYLTHDKHQADLGKTLRKRDRDDDNKDEHPSAGPNPSKKNKQGRTKESESSKKSSITKESSKGKSPAKTSKYGKSMTAKEPLEELVFEMASDDIEQTVDDMVNDVGKPPYDTTQTKDK
ncbi:hypothetical protein Tco_0157205 [Tanacetum coccineum]